LTGVNGSDLAKAMGLCQTTTVNPPIAQKTWGLIAATQLLANGNAPNAAQLTNLQNSQMAVLTNYGIGGVVPTEGAVMAGLSTGRMRDANDPGFVLPNQGTDFGLDSQPPAAYLAAHGGALPSSSGCSGNCPAGTGANDPANLRLRIRVPTNVSALTYQYRFFSAEYWEYSCSQFNDYHLALLQSNVAGLPADRNIAFDSMGNVMSVNSAFLNICQVKGCYTCAQGVGPLAGTGMDANASGSSGNGRTGGGTTWLTVTAPVVPGEVIELDLMVFDVSDKIYDSVVLFDNFTWLPIPP
jgi:hypothetical protein